MHKEAKRLAFSYLSTFLDLGLIFKKKTGMPASAEEVWEVLDKIACVEVFCETAQNRRWSQRKLILRRDEN